jgi:anti-sigma factor RsiW
MTEWNRPVRHIPDDELHAYLDQALSRSQAAEIERHLARCPRCQAGRDGIAGLRDRTTDILAGLGAPSVILSPPYADLVARHVARGTRRSGWGARLAGRAGRRWTG